ncbi:hypothetical protein HY477_02430 [Candidatus Uhrbacteria bacterium]|nr:hypothetical protein [Candidatus Uhrbacteria bacterium]
MMRLSGLKIFVSIVVGAVVAVVAVGLYLAGSPGQERNRRFDEQRVNALQQISSTLQFYFDRTATLPQTLDELQGKPDYFLPSLLDPKDGAAYEYRVTATGVYELCASFDLPSSATNDSRYPKPAYEPYRSGAQSDFWKHETGRQCFTFEAITPAGSNCVLMKHATTGKVGCFGCARRVCIDPAPGYELYKAPFEENYIGIPYRCFETDEGCALAQ